MKQRKAQFNLGEMLNTPIATSQSWTTSSSSRFCVQTEAWLKNFSSGAGKSFYFEPSLRRWLDLWVRHGMVSLWHPVLRDDLSSGCFLLTTAVSSWIFLLRPRGTLASLSSLWCRASNTSVPRTSLSTSSGTPTWLLGPTMRWRWRWCSAGFCHRKESLSQPGCLSGGCLEPSSPPSYQHSCWSSSATSPTSSSPSSL